MNQTNTSIDPDLNFEAPDIGCDYYDQDQFLDNFRSNTDSKLLHINARSLPKNISNIVNYLNLLENCFSVIGISETWLKDIQDPLIQIQNYTIEGICRQNKRGGGVALYIKQDLGYSIRNDLSVNDSEIESCFIELVNTHRVNVIIGIVYKPPCASCENFTDQVNKILGHVNAENKKCYIMGDFNINLLQYDTDNTVKNFINVLSSHSFYPTISKPTRITSYSSTLIDNILTNDFLNHSAGILVTDISDHLPVFLIIDQFKEKNQGERKYVRRDFNMNNVKCFNDDLNETDWNFLKSPNDIHDIYNTFLEHVQTLYDKNFPVQEIKCRYDKYKSPWLSDGIYNSIRRKNYLYKKFLKNPTLQNKSCYTVYKNKLYSLIRISKKNYLSKKFNQEKGNVKGTWKLINSLLNKNRQKANPSYFIQDEKRIDDNKEIADSFSDYFVNIGTRLASNLPLCNTAFESFLNNRCSHSLFLTPITQEEIVDILNNIPHGKASGCDGLNSFVIKQASYSLAKPLAELFNMSLALGIFPDGLKIGKVTPIHKKGKKHDINNYRPITVVSIFSKTYEKLIYSRLNSFISKNNILSESQFGFRENRSTDLAITYVVNKLSQAIDDKNISVGIFLDLSKAFDTVNHEILLRKLEHYGIRGIALDLFKSYLSNRKQFVSYNAVNSIDQLISCGVPQGSVLGPLLFIIYINDICNSSDIISFCLFADDTSLLYSHNNVDAAIQNLNLELQKISTWLLANKLCINVLKSNYVIFCANQYKYTQSIPLVLNGISLNQVKVTKFLGIYIDEHLTWKYHINDVSSKLSKNVGIMNRLKFFLPSNILLTIYNSFVLPYLNYCILIWGGSSTRCERLFTLQKRAVRIISNAGYRDHSAPLFKQFKLLKLNDLYCLNLGKFMYKYNHNALPSCFNSFFTLTSNIHSYDTRSTRNKKLYVRFNRTSLFRNSLVQRGTTYWNSLSDSLKSSPTLSNFAKKIKAQFFNS